MTARRDGRVVHTMRVAVGKASTTTPVGLFAVTDTLRIDGGSRAYGCCALPITGRQPESARARTDSASTALVRADGRLRGKQ